MFGVPLEGNDAARIFCDNMSVVNNCTKVESQLKKHNALAYHYVRWTVAAGAVSVAWIDTKENLANALTKCVDKYKRKYLFGSWTYGCYNAT